MNRRGGTGTGLLIGFIVGTMFGAFIIAYVVDIIAGWL